MTNTAWADPSYGGSHTSRPGGPARCRLESSTTCRARGRAPSRRGSALGTPAPRSEQRACRRSPTQSRQPGYAVRRSRVEKSRAAAPGPRATGGVGLEPQRRQLASPPRLSTDGVSPLGADVNAVRVPPAQSDHGSTPSTAVSPLLLVRRVARSKSAVVPASSGEAAERDQADQRDQDAEPQAPEDRDDDPDDDERLSTPRSEPFWLNHAVRLVSSRLSTPEKRFPCLPRCAPESRDARQREQVDADRRASTPCRTRDDVQRAGSGSLGPLFDHVGIAVSDLAASERFYRTVLSVLVVEPSHADAELVEWDDWAIGPT